MCLMTVYPFTLRHFVFIGYGFKKTQAVFSPPFHYGQMPWATRSCFNLPGQSVTTKREKLQEENMKRVRDRCQQTMFIKLQSVALGEC